MNRRYANGQIHQLPHTTVSIEYAWGQDSTVQADTSSAQAAAPAKRMTVTYPHPSPKYGRKYAEVTVQHESAITDTAAGAISHLVTNPFKRQDGLEGAEQDSLLRLIIPREELEFLLRDLVADSYFDREERIGDVNLSVTLGSRTTYKTWDRIASFDQLAERVIEQNNELDRRRPANGGKVIPASAELLPPTEEFVEDAPDAIIENSPENVKGPGRLHGVPQF
jgi:hypothetical protein